MALALAAPVILALAVILSALDTFSPRLYAFLSRHLKRLFSFSLIGAFVFVSGTALQWATIGRLGSNGSYAVQCVFSVELSYFLNRWFTWRDRDTPHSLVKWNLQRVGLTVPNWIGYAALIHLGAPWLVANVTVTAVFTVINYVAGDIWSFRKSGRTDAAVLSAAPSASRRANWLPTVSVVIPCKANQRTIAATVTALFAQDYPNLIEVILVGDVDDPTWQALDGITDTRLVVLEHAVEPNLRDPNVKRDKGLSKARGEVLALADSDIVMDRDWLTRAVGLLRQQGSGMVAGGMRSIHDTFWGRFVDGNVVAAKTPRLPRPYLVTAERFGKRGYKPPISANAVFTRDLYETTPLDTAWFYGYEDYEWLWRVAKDGHKVLFSGDLTAAHHHRRSYRKLLQEYGRASEGCAAFVRRHPSSPLARKRLTQALTLPAVAAVGLSMAGFGVAQGYAAPVGAVMLLGFLLLAGREVARTRRLEAVTYPLIGLSLAGAFTINLAKHLVVPDSRPIDRVQTWDERPSTHNRNRRLAWPLLGVLALQTVISVVLLRSNTAFTDEALYLWAGHLEWAHWLHGAPLPNGTGLTEPFQTYFSGAPQIYPPIGAVANSLGGIFAARVLGLLFMLGATFMLYLVAAKLFDRTVAVSAAALWAIGEPTLRLAFATFDPLAMFFASLAVWLIAQAGSRKRRGELVAAAAVTAALSCVTAYSNTVFLPVIFVVAFMIWRPTLGRGGAAVSTAWLAAATGLTFLGLLTVLHDWPGIIHTVFARSLNYDHTQLSLIVGQSWKYSGILPIVALGSAAMAVAARAEHRWFVSILALSSLVVPIGQIHAATAWSIDKHLAEGLWFAAIAGGYGCAKVYQMVDRHWRWPVAAAASVLLLFPAAYGAQNAWNAYHYWPNANSFVSAFRKVVAHEPGPILVEQGGDGANDIAAYSTPQGMDWSRWPSEYFMSLGRSGPSASWYSTYRAQLAKVNAGTITVFYKTGLSSPSVPSKLLFGSYNSAGSAAALLNVVAANTGLPGLPAFTKAIEADHSYYLAEVGPYDGSSADWTYAIWAKR